ncbi:MAG: TIGR01459 family HAD-type hydrolase [Paracoccaceae bacterium]
MTRIVQSLAEIAAPYEALLVDLWGCLHNGRQAFPEALAALKSYRETGGAVILLTNAPRPAGPVRRQLDRLGVPAALYDAIVTSGEAAQAALVAGAVGSRVWHLGPDKDEPFFTELAPDLVVETPVERVSLDEAEGIVCTGLFDDLTETPDDYRAQLLLGKTRGLPMLCANPDIAVDLGDRRIFCGGALGQLYAEMGGEVLYFGKPHPPIYDLARRRLAALRGDDIPDSAVLATGDGIGTDIQGGVGEGFDTLFITGGLAAAEFGDDPANPDPARLEAWLAKRQLSPSYAIGQLR